MKILIVGAGIAGSATAVLLSRHGHEVTVIDAATEPYSGGYLLLLNDTARKVMDQLGARDLVNDLSAPTPTIGVHWSGRKLTEFTPSGYRLARRGDLVGAFSQMASEEVPITFGKKLSGVSTTCPGSPRTSQIQPLKTSI
ncbi:MAG TPA: FAD-dependent oxidoreductase [Roseiflexaceae bacterium]|nr:FAD-dependent oxidoreductase [Roseiflexaceae bacterium]